MEGDLTVHICDPSYSGGRDRRISVQSQHKQKLARSYIKKKKKKPGILAQTCNSSYLENRGQMIKVQGQPTQKPKILKEKN
jgi:hypothetical protein